MNPIAVLLLLVMESSALLMICLGLPLMRRQVRPNRYYGFRVPATLRDEELWYDVNEATGRDFVHLGLVSLPIQLLLALCPLTLEQFAFSCIALQIVGLAGATIHGFVLIRRRRS